eukprot:6296110-Heterocapsa_arctica.AAC.1
MSPSRRVRRRRRQCGRCEISVMDMERPDSGHISVAERSVVEAKACCKTQAATPVVAAAPPPCRAVPSPMSYRDPGT